MTEQIILSKLFSLECRFDIGYKNIEFHIGGMLINWYNNIDLLIFNHKRDLLYKIQFCEIDDIKITDKTVTFLLKDGGYEFKDGDKKVIRRKKMTEYKRPNQCFYKNCKSTSCYNHIYSSKDNGKLYNEVACQRHIEDLNKDSDERAPEIMKVFSSGCSKKDRRNLLSKEE